MEIRTARGLTQSEVARRSPDLTPTGVCRIERGERYPNLQTLEAIAYALRVTITIDRHGTSITT